MTYELYIDGQPAGRVDGEAEGSRVLLRAVCPLRGDGIYKAFLTGEGARLALGVMMPQRGEMLAARVVPARELAALGAQPRGEAVMTVRFAAPAERVAAPLPGAAPADGWQPEPRPERLFADPWVAALWTGVPDCLVKKGKNGTWLAAALQDKAPFGPLPLFCLGRAETVRGRNCLLFKINPAGHPVPAE